MCAESWNHRSWLLTRRVHWLTSLALPHQWTPEAWGSSTGTQMNKQEPRHHSWSTSVPKISERQSQNWQSASQASGLLCHKNLRANALFWLFTSNKGNKRAACCMGLSATFTFLSTCLTAFVSDPLPKLPHAVAFAHLCFEIPQTHGCCVTRHQCPWLFFALIGIFFLVNWPELLLGWFSKPQICWGHILSLKLCETTWLFSASGLSIVTKLLPTERTRFCWCLSWRLSQYFYLEKPLLLRQSDPAK